MPKLSWLAFSGNGFSEISVVEPLALIDWNSLEVSYLLGEGASGIISKATWRTEGKTEEVAVKVFKGSVTSDGLPEDEMNTCIAAGMHPGLVQLIGRIIAHPEDKKGLVMKLIPGYFYNLGIPPSFESCTRDVFREEMNLTTQQVLKIACTIVSVATQLHSKGIMHSDLYAHNILFDGEGNTLFGDFGAACFYNKADTEVAYALERLEVSAYGCLLDDLLSLCNEANEHPILLKLGSFRDMCMAPDVSSRPSFQYLKDELLEL